MTDTSARKPYVKPILRKRDRLSEVTESDTIVVTGQPLPKGGCFSNSR